MTDMDDKKIRELIANENKVDPLTMDSHAMRQYMLKRNANVQAVRFKKR